MLSAVLGLALTLGPVFASEKPDIFVQMGHTHNVTSVAFSPDGTYALSGSIDKTIKLWDASTGREIRTFSGSASRVTSIAVSPDGRYAVSGDEDRANNLKLWDIRTGKLIRSFSGLEGGMGAHTALAFTPDGKHLLSGGGMDNTLQLWDVSSGREIRKYSGTTAPVTSIAIAVTPDGKYVVSGSWDNSVTYTENPDGTSNRISAKSTDNTIRVWEIATGRQVNAFHNSGGWVSTIAITPDGRHVISGQFEDSARMWEIATGRQVKVFDMNGVSSIAISPDGKYALFGCVMEMRLWDIKAGREIKAFKGHEGWVRSIAFSPDGKYALAGDDSTTPKLWDIASGRQVRAFGGDTNQVASVALSPDGNHMVMAQSPGLLNTWDIATAQQLGKLKHTLGIRTLSISSDGSRVAAGGWDFSKHASALDVWEMETGKEAGAIRKEGGHWVHAAVISPDKLHVLWSNYDTLRLSEIATGRVIKTFSGGHGSEIHYAAMSTDGRFAVSSDILTTNIWEIASGSIVKSFKNEGGIPTVVCSDGKIVLMMSMAQKIVFTFWDLSTNREIRTLHADYDTKTGWQGGAHLAAMNSDARYVLWSDNRVLHLWDMQSGKEIRTFSGHINDISSIGFTPDKKHVFSGSHDGTSRLWDIATGKEIAQFINFSDGEWIAITPEGYYNASPNGDRHLNVRVGTSVYGIENYREAFLRPDLVKLALTGGSLQGYRTLSDVKPPPKVAIVRTSASSAAEEFTLTLRLEEQGGGIGDVRLFLNGSAVMLDNGRALKTVQKDGNNSSYRSYTLKLAPGSNSIRAVAFNADNSMQGNDATHQVMASFIATRKPAIHALIIGINDFKNPKLRLKYSVADANLFADTLRSAATGLFEQVHISILTTRETTTRERIKKELAALRSLHPDDLFVLYVASHGTVDNGEYFLITSNVGLTSTERLKQDALTQTELKELVANIPTTKKVIVLDTCNAGAMGDAIQMAMLTRGMNEDTAIKILSRAVGSAIFSASTSMQEAMEGYQGHGLFTWVLAEGLSGKADKTKSGYIKTTDLKDYVESEVPDLAEKVFKRAQYPTVPLSGQGFPIGKTR